MPMLASPKVRPTRRPAAPPRGFVAAVDGFVRDIYRTGFVQSLILHLIILLAMALAATRSPRDASPVALTLDFGEEEAAIEVAAAAEPIVAAVPLPEAEPREPAMFPDPLTRFEAVAVEIPEVDLAALERAGDSSAVPTEHLLAALPAAATIGTAAAVAATGPAVESLAATDGWGAGAGNSALGGELGRRLRFAGARTGDVQVSIRWDSIDDIDVHVFVDAADGRWMSAVNWMTRFGVCGGILDVDANAAPTRLTWQPVENVYWAKGRAPYGRFTVAVHHFRNWSGGRRTPVEVAVLVDGNVQRFTVALVPGEGLREITTFVRVPGTTYAPAAPPEPTAGR